MAEVTNSMYQTSASVSLDFTSSTTSVAEFATKLESLNTTIGNMSVAINAMATGLKSLRTEANERTGNKLKTSIENEVNRVLAASSVSVLGLDGNNITISKTTTDRIFRHVNNAVNAKLAESFAKIVFDVDPNLSLGKVNLPANAFKDLNTAIAELVRVQINNFNASLKKMGAEAVSAEDLKNLNFTISKATVQTVLNKIRTKITQSMLNPTIADAPFKMTEADFEKVHAAIKQKVTQAIAQSATTIKGEAIPIGTANLNRIYKAIDKSTADYIRGVTTSINGSSNMAINVPLKEVTKTTQKYLAGQLGVSLDEFQKNFKSTGVSRGDILQAGLQPKVAQMQRALDQLTNKEITEYFNRATSKVRNSIDLKDYSAGISSHLKHEMRKFSEALVAKIKQQITDQFRQMTSEINGVNINPRRLGVNNVVRQGTRQIIRNERINRSNQPQQQQPRQYVQGSDPYNRRDNYYNSFGLTGALTNTVRHIVAGSMIGMPLAALAQAVDTFRTTQLEQTKIFSNLLLKDEYKVTDSAGNSTGQIDFAKVNLDVEDLKPFLNNLAEFYGMTANETYQVASVGARVADNPTQLRYFVNAVARIRAIDYEADPVTQIAPGLEAMKGQYGLEIAEFEDRVVKPLAIVTNLTNASTAQVLDAMKRSGASFRNANVSPENALALSAVSVQQTGLSGSNIGNFFTSILTRFQREETKAFMEDELNIQLNDERSGAARDGVEIFMELADKISSATDVERSQILYQVFGGYQVNKGSSLMNGLMGDPDPEKAMNAFLRIQDQYAYWGLGGDVIDTTSPAYQQGQQEFNTLMRNQTQASVITLDRAAVSLDLALTSLLEELSPAIIAVAEELTQFGRAVRENSGAVADFISTLGTALLGYAAFRGAGMLYNKTGWKENTESIRDIDRIVGYKSPLSNREGRIGALFGGIGVKGIGDIEGVNEDLFRDTPQNREQLQQYRANPVIAPFIAHLANMDEKEKKQLSDYMREKNKVAYSYDDLFRNIRDAQGYEAVADTPEKARENARRNIQALGRNKNLPYMKTLYDEVSVNDVFDSRRKEDSSIMEFLVNADSADRRSFSSYVDRRALQDPLFNVDNHDALLNAFDSYRHELSELERETREAADSADELERALDDVGRTSRRRNNRDANEGNMLSRLSSGARGGITSLLGGLKSGLVGLAALSAFYVAGSVLEGGIYNLTNNAQDRQYNDAERAVNDVNEMFKTYELREAGGFGGAFGLFMQAVEQFGNSVKNFASIGTPNVSVGTQAEVEADFLAYAKEVHGIDMAQRYADATTVSAMAGAGSTGSVAAVPASQYDANAALDLIRAQYEARGEDFDESAIQQDFLVWSGRQEELDKMAQEQYNKEYAQQIEDQQEQARRQELAKEAQERAYAEAMARKDYINYDFGGRTEWLEEQVSELQPKQQAALNRLRLDGIWTESQRYLEERKAWSQQIIDLYQGEINTITDMIADLRQKIAEAEANGVGEDDPELKKWRGELAEAQDALEDAKEEWQPKIDEQLLAQKDMDFENSVNMVNRDVGLIQTRAGIQDVDNALNYDRNSDEYFVASIANTKAMIAALNTQYEQLVAAAKDEAQLRELEPQLEQLKATIRQESLAVKDLALQRIGAYKVGLQDEMDIMNIDYMQAQVDSGITDESNPYLRNLRINQYEQQIGMFSEQISQLQSDLANTADVELANQIQREIRDLQRQSLSAQLGILDEMKQEGATFNLPDNVAAMSYYEYMTRDNSHQTYTVQQGDIMVNITMPSNTTAAQAQTVGRNFALGLQQGTPLRLQSQNNPFPYRVGTY